MKNKKKLLIAVAAMGLLAVGTAGVGTAAWFTASSSATANNGSAASGSITTVASTKDMAGTFTINPQAVGTIENIALTDDTGGIHVSVSDGAGGYTTYVATAAGGNKAATIALQAIINYSGPLTDVSAIQAQWEATVATVTLTLTCSAASGTPVSGSGADVSDIRFVTDATAATVDNTDPGVVTLDADDFTFTSVTATSATTVGTVYVAITGDDDVIWDSTHKPSYTLSLAASHTDA